jgi:hypothetical protein
MKKVKTEDPYADIRLGGLMTKSHNWWEEEVNNEVEDDDEESQQQ